jgi:tRNA(fMet)-specific endonuclease VapC
LYDLAEQIEQAGIPNYFLSEITIAELKYGAENSAYPEKNHAKILILQERFTVIPIFNSLDVYAKEKARLRKSGKLVDDFDLLIGATAIFNKLTLITKNTSDFVRLDGIQLEDWTQ